MFSPYDPVQTNAGTDHLHFISSPLHLTNLCYVVWGTATSKINRKTVLYCLTSGIPKTQPTRSFYTPLLTGLIPITRHGPVKRWRIFYLKCFSPRVLRMMSVRYPWKILCNTRQGWQECVWFLFDIHALIVFVYFVANSALITLNVKTIWCYTVKIIKELKIV